MKAIKKLTLVLIISLFTANTAYAACDCSDPKGFHCKMTCKLKGESPTSTGESGADGDGLWNKIKNFKIKGFDIGGEPVDKS